MGLIKALMNATGSTLADQYKEFVTCDEMGANVLVRKGKVLRTQDSTNAGRDNILTDGTGVVVNDGQAMLIVENGKIVDFCIEPGKYIYKNDATPSLLTGGWEGLKSSFKTLGERIQTGGQQFHDQRVYYVNTKEIMGNKFGIGNVPFRDSEFDFTMKISAYGEYSYRITDPLMFYSNVTGHVDRDFTRDKIDSQFKAEVQSSIQPALGRIALKKICYDQLPLFTKEIGNELNQELTNEWVNKRGMSVVSFAVASVTPDPDSAKKIEEFQATRAYTNPSMLGARLGMAQANAMENAAKNDAGAMTGFMGLGFAQQAGGMNAAELLKMGQTPQQTQQPTGWACSCGAANTGKFCSECGAKPETPGEWTCSCGHSNTGKFCSECGNKKQTNTCTNCGYEAEAPFKFCPECGTVQ